MTKKPSERYTYDRMIAFTITAILKDQKKITFYHLRNEINTRVHLMVELKRKRRSTDKNKGYVPSPAKISTTIHQLLGWNWLEKKEVIQYGVDQGGEDKVISKKTYYNLTDHARYVSSVGLYPDQAYMLEDLYQMILRTSSLGIYTIAQDEFSGNSQFTKCDIIPGTSIDDIYFKRDRLRYANFNYRNYSRKEIEKIFKKALLDEVVKAERIKSVERYVIDPRLKEFIDYCWKDLYFYTLYVVRYAFILKKLPKRDLDYKNIIKWLSSQNEIEHVQAEFINNWASERAGFSKLKKELQKAVDNFANEIPKKKICAEQIFERNNDSDSFEKFKKVKDSVINFVCPDYLFKTVKNILIAS